MIHHAGFHVSDIAKAKSFYAAALAPLGYLVNAEYPEWNVAGMGAAGENDFWLVGDGSSQANHIAFLAKGKQEVDDFYKAGLKAGGIDNGAPGYRKNYAPGYYAAFVKDPDGHNVEVVFMDPNAPAE
jgi:predicted lactoylglutathione lyase